LSKAKEAGTSGKILNKLFDNVIRLASRMRETTGISKDVVSLGDVAVKLVDEKAGLDSKKKVLILGTGEPAAMIAKTLNKKEISYDVASRTLDRATGFSQVLILGTGEPAAMIAKTLNKKEISYDVASRTLDRATGFSQLL
jgi:glutamyl-tRNA reductase